MKNLTFISIKQVLVCCISILLLSCSSDAKYSCNPEVEKWARTNIDKAEFNLQMQQNSD